jgi:serine/threonine protein kinase
VSPRTTQAAPGSLDVRLAPPDGQLGPWRLERELGRGGMGAVYQAVDPGGRRVALKVALTVGGVVALAREARVLALAGSHPDLVATRGRVVASGRSVLVLELLPGAPLDERLGRAGPLRPAEAARALAPVARALAHLHARGVVHRDVKPSNVVVRPDGRGVLIDLGLARGPDERPGRDGVGTPAYMPCEQLRGGPVGPAADVYGLGATLHEALTGRLPHPAEEPGRLLALRVLGEVTPPRALVADLPPALEALLRACLALRPGARPTADQVTRALEAAACAELGPVRVA